MALASNMRLRTVDRVHDLAVGTSGPALLDLGVVDLQELVQPREQFGPGLSHACKTRKGVWR